MLERLVGKLARAPAGNDERGAGELAGRLWGEPDTVAAVRRRLGTMATWRARRRARTQRRARFWGSPAPPSSAHASRFAMNVFAALPPSLRRTRLHEAKRWRLEPWLCIAGVLACGGEVEPGDAGPAEIADDCASGAGCEPARCEGLACVAPSAVRPVPAGELACSVVSCPFGTDICCSSVSASATGNDEQAYAPRVQLVDSARSRFGEVRAEFTFDAPNQQGWITFELGAELDLARLAFIGRHEGVADRFLAVNTNRLDEGGCAFSFDLDPRGPFVFGNDVQFNNAAFCYGNGRPGRASELAFAIFSTRPGPAALVISNLALIPD